MQCNLSEKQKAILIGLILGDGSLEFNGYKGTRLQVKQSEEKKEYVEWIYENFQNITRTPPQQRKDTNQWYFGTRFYTDLEVLRQQFYIDRTKRIPETIVDMVTDPLTIAVWFMDDGRIDYRPKSHYAFHLAIDAFTRQEARYLQKLLRKFNISANIILSRCRGKLYPKLYIGKEGRDNFHSLVRPYVLDCFHYKLPPIHKCALTPQRLHAEPHYHIVGDDIVRSS